MTVTWCMCFCACSLVLTKIKDIEANGGVEAVGRAMVGGAGIWGDLEVRACRSCAYPEQSDVVKYSTMW